MSRVYKSTPSGKLTESQSVLGNHGLICGIQIITNGVADVTVTCWDNPSAASGTIAAQFKVSGAENYGGAIFFHPKKVLNGIYVEISGTEGAAIIDYVPGE